MSTNTSIGTFQITTDQVNSTNESSVDAQFVNVGNEQFRIDTSSQNTKSPHYRADQLKAFTSWLSQTNQNAAVVTQTQPAHQTAGVSTKKMFRVDGPVTKAKSNSGTISKGPNFDTSNYVGHPEEIAKTIRQLKSDGRIIADHQQLESPLVQSPSAQSLSAQALNWPEVSSRLIGSPAILNLEMNIQPFISKRANQIAICSTTEGTGASTVSMALARQMSEHGQNVLIVDANLRNAAVTNRLCSLSQKSWIHSISQRQALTSIIIRDTQSNVSLLPLSPIKSVGWPRKLLNELAAIINSVSYDYNLVLFDIGTASQFINESDSASLFGDVVLLVSGRSESENSQLQNSTADLKSIGARNLIVVENFARNEHPMQSKVG